MIMGSNMPASVSTPKKIMAKINIAATGAMFWIPFTAKLKVSRPNPASNAIIMGTHVNAESAETFLLKISPSNNMIITTPGNAM